MLKLLSWSHRNLLSGVLACEGMLERAVGKEDNFRPIENWLIRTSANSLISDLDFHLFGTGDKAYDSVEEYTKLLNNYKLTVLPETVMNAIRHMDKQFNEDARALTTDSDIENLKIFITDMKHYLKEKGIVADEDYSVYQHYEDDHLNRMDSDNYAQFYERV